MSDTVKLYDKGLKQIIAAFGKKIPKVRIGIMGDDGARQPKAPPEIITYEALMARETNKPGVEAKTPAEPPSNAQVLAAHEYGTAHSPQRSVLRVPIADNLAHYLQRAGAFDDKVLTRLVESGEIRPFMEKIAITAETVVDDGFETGGFGKWKPSDMTRKTVAQTLVETTQMRKAITSEVD